MPGFNLKSIKQVFSSEVKIKDPNGEPTEVVFELAGPEHPDRKRIVYAQNRKLMNFYAKNGRHERQDPEEIEVQKKENLAAFTLGWKGYVDDSGAAVPFSKSAALDLYTDPEMAWLVDQLATALDDKELFIKRFATA